MKAKSRLPVGISGLQAGEDVKNLLRDTPLGEPLCVARCRWLEGLPACARQDVRNVGEITGTSLPPDDSLIGYRLTLMPR